MGFALFWYLIKKFSTFAADPERAGPGCLIQILGLLFQTILIALFVFLLLPIFLGQSQSISWQAVEPLGFVAIRASLLALIIVTLISFLPFLGRWMAGSPGLETFLLATLTFRFLSPLYINALVGDSIPMKSFFPGVWDSLGYLLMALVLTRLTMVVVFYLKKPIGPYKSNQPGLWGPLIDILAGILPFLMYAQGVALRVQAALSHIP